MEYASEKRGDAVVLTARGRLDAVTASGFEAECGKLLDDGATCIVVDLGGLEFISSAGLRSILSSGKKCKAAGCALRFCNLEGMVQDVFKVSGFASMFPVFADADAAVAG